MPGFDPHHISIGRDEVAGNGGRGRVFFLPGSNSRAKQIAERFRDVRVFPSPRHLDAYLGVVEEDGQSVDVCAISTGMGCPSLDIVVTELILLGARRLLRVGTSGSLQPQAIRTGDLVIATSAVRDEGTSDVYAPREIPAVGHPDWTNALVAVANRRGLGDRTFAGPVHCKDSLYGREFAFGPEAERNAAYMKMLRKLGVLATEMESAHLFILAAVHGTKIANVGRITPSSEVVKAGAVLAVIGDDAAFSSTDEARRAEERAIDVSLSGAVELMRREG